MFLVSPPMPSTIPPAPWMSTGELDARRSAREADEYGTGWALARILHSNAEKNRDELDRLRAALRAIVNLHDADPCRIAKHIATKALKETK
jgi:hypothetical protein